jgi:hypothetical protein
LYGHGKTRHIAHHAPARRKNALAGPRNGIAGISVHDAANVLDAEATVIADRQLLEFARELEVFSASQFTTRYH